MWDNGWNNYSLKNITQSATGWVRADAHLSGKPTSALRFRLSKYKPAGHKKMLTLQVKDQDAYLRFTRKPIKVQILKWITPLP